MKYLLILAAAAAAIVFYLRMQKTTDTSADGKQVDATYVCDVCGEHECICREEKHPDQ